MHSCALNFCALCRGLCRSYAPLSVHWDCIPIVLSEVSVSDSSHSIKGLSNRTAGERVPYVHTQHLAIASKTRRLQTSSYNSMDEIQARQRKYGTGPRHHRPLVGIFIGLLVWVTVRRYSLVLHSVDREEATPRRFPQTQVDTDSRLAPPGLPVDNVVDSKRYKDVNRLLNEQTLQLDMDMEVSSESPTPVTAPSPRISEDEDMQNANSSTPPVGDSMSASIPIPDVDMYTPRAVDSRNSRRRRTAGKVRVHQSTNKPPVSSSSGGNTTLLVDETDESISAGNPEHNGEGALGLGLDEPMKNPKP
eukprot:1178541-Prorocentrum_minimum.AAC.3